MLLSIKSGIPEKYYERIENKIIFIVMRRCLWILPAAVSITLAFIILVGITPYWGDNTFSFIIVDAVNLVIFSFIYFLYRQNRIINYNEVGRVHRFIQDAFSGSVIIYGAVITAFDASSSVGFTTFIICLFFVGGLMFLKPVKLLIMALSGIAVQAVIMSLLNRQVTVAGAIQDIFLFFIVILMVLFMNRFSVKHLVDNFLLNEELEEKVEIRTAQLEEETKRALQSDNLKTVFLANMSHEIRTPLNGIIGFSNLLRDNGIDAVTRLKYIDIVIHSGKTLLDILNGILEVARIESGECELYLEEFSINDVFSEVIDSFKGEDKIRSGTITISNISENAPEILMFSDRLKIVQILINLVNNAIKYSDEGDVSIEFSMIDDSMVEISVKDTGKGIAEDDLSQIFDRFQQLNRDPYTSGTGVGLGLTIVKSYTEMLGGSISVKSEAGKGSEFTFTLPLRR